jgi:glutathione S-transferase
MRPTQASIVLEELGIPYKAEIVDITKNTQKEDWCGCVSPVSSTSLTIDGLR